MRTGIQKQVCPLLSTGLMPWLGTVPSIGFPKQSQPPAKDSHTTQRHGDGSPQAVFRDDKG